MHGRNFTLINKNLSESGVEVLDLCSKSLFHTMLPKKIINDMKPDVVRTLNDPNAESYDLNLAGRIENGLQVKLDISQSGEGVSTFVKLAEDLGTSYVERFFGRTFGDSKAFEGKVTMNDIWIVSQRENDYNPLHIHNNASPAGLSGVVYIEVPQQLEDKDSSVVRRKDGQDGWLNIVFGTQTQVDMNNFAGPECFSFEPIPGRLLLFPQNTPHLVYPFKGSGDRICVAFNLNVWYRQSGITQFIDLLQGAGIEFEDYSRSRSKPGISQNKK